jgi:hypothetical protein
MLVLAYDYPLLGAIWTMFIFFLWIAWLFLLFKIFGDIFRSRDMGGGAKALWCIFVIIAPFLGTFIYVIVRGQSMGERDIEAFRAQQQQFETYVKETAGSGNTADELAKLADLKAKGVLTDAEFDAQKAKLLA